MDPGTDPGTDPSGELAIELAHEVRMPGQQQRAYGYGFLPGETVTGTQYSAPLALGTQVANAQGEVAFTWSVPANASVGTHTVELVGAESGAIAADFRVVAANQPGGGGGPGAKGGLATTGFDPGPVVPIALLVLAAGAVIVAASRRKPRIDHTRE